MITSERPPQRVGGTSQTAVDANRPLRLYAFYGTLMARGGWWDAGICLPGGEPCGRSLGPCRFNGNMYAVGLSFPAVLPGKGIVHGELWEAFPEHQDIAQAKLDQIESYFPDREPSSLYLRRRIRLLEPEMEAWVYIWNRSMDGLHPLPDGRWRRYADELDERLARAADRA